MVEAVTSIAGFEGLKPEWNRLLEASPSNCFFLSWEWVHTWWKHLSDNRQLFLVTLRCGEELVAIVPLAWTPPRPPLGRPFGTLEFLGTGSVGSDYLDLIIRGDREEELLPVLTKYLARQRSALKLTQVRRDSSLAREFARHWQARGGTLREGRSNVCPAIQLGGHTWDSYLATLGSEHRYNFRRKLRNLSTRFDVQFELARSEEQRKEALGILISLHSSRWQNRGGSDAFVSTELISFHDELSSLALQRGWLRLFTLRLDGKPVASLYGFQYNRTFYFYQSGFDSSYARYSVGLIAMGLAIQAALQEGAQEYDLLHGDEEYKFHWARESHDIGWFEFYPPGTLGMVLRHIRGAGRGVRRMARNMLPHSMAVALATVRRKRAIKNPYVSHAPQDRQFPCLTVDRDG